MDKKALGSLGGLVENCHLHTVTATTSALELWNSLKATYARQSIANQLQLGCQLHNFMKGKDETISEFFAHFQTIAMALESAKAPISDSDRHFLAGLPKEYEHYVKAASPSHRTTPQPTSPRTMASRAIPQQSLRPTATAATRATSGPTAASSSASSRPRAAAAGAGVATAAGATATSLRPLWHSWFAPASPPTLTSWSGSLTPVPRHTCRHTTCSSTATKCSSSHSG